MFVRTLDELEKLERIKFPSDHSFRSARFLIASDDMGFSYNENRVNKGVILNVWLKNHWEANYIVSGRVEVTDSESGKKWSLEAGALYVVGPNDRHQLQFKEDECHLSVFFPPLSGNEHFDEDGSYEPSGPIEKTDRRMFVRHVDKLRKAGCEVMKNNGQLRTIEMLGENDGIGFGLSDIRLEAGATADFQFENTRAAFHVLSGSGVATNVKNGESYDIEPGKSISVMQSDAFKLHTTSGMHLLKITSNSMLGYQ